jgi:hypothetical protein
LKKNPENRPILVAAGYGRRKHQALEQLQGYEWWLTMDDVKPNLDEDKTKGVTTDPSPLTLRRLPLLRTALLLLVCLGIGAGVLSTVYFGYGGKPKTMMVVAHSWDQKDNVDIWHDFGLLRPNIKVRHRFSIPNDSNIAWTLLRIQHSCKCTASDPLAQTVLPGQSMEIDVEYTAPDLSKDDSRQVGVEFAEPSVPYFWLKIRATTRELLSLSPAALSFQVDSKGQLDHGEFRVSNFLQHDLPQPRVVCSVPWLKAEIRPATVVAERFPPRQAWQVRVTADTTQFQPGEYFSQVEVRTDDPEAPRKVIPVDLTVKWILELVPRELAFGPVSPGKAANRKVLLKLSPSVSPLHSADIKIEHDLGERLVVNCRELSVKVLEISAALAVKKGDATGKIHGVVQLRFKDESLAPLEIPVSAEIR